MKPVNFPESNDVLKAPPSMPDCQDLPIFRLTNPVDLVISCWEMSEEEFQQIAKSRRIYLSSWSETHPPIYLSSNNPFISENTAP